MFPLRYVRRNYRLHGTHGVLLTQRRIVSYQQFRPDKIQNSNFFDWCLGCWFGDGIGRAKVERYFFFCKHRIQYKVYDMTS